MLYIKTIFSILVRQFHQNYLAEELKANNMFIPFDETAVPNMKKKCLFKLVDLCSCSVVISIYIYLAEELKAKNKFIHFDNTVVLY